MRPVLFSAAPGSHWSSSHRVFPAQALSAPRGAGCLFSPRNARSATSGKTVRKNTKLQRLWELWVGKKTSGMILGWCWDDLPLFIMLHHVSGLCGASVWVDDQKLPKVCAKPSKTHILACKRRVTPRKANSPATSQSFRYINYKKNQNDQQTYNQDHTQIHLLHLSSWCNYDNVRCSPLNDPKDNQPMRRSSY